MEWNESSIRFFLHFQTKVIQILEKGSDCLHTDKHLNAKLKKNKFVN